MLFDSVNLESYWLTSASVMLQQIFKFPPVTQYM